MSDNSTPPSSLESEGGTDYTPKTYDIAPHEEERAEAIRNYDPVFDVPGAVSADKLTMSRLLGGKGLADLTLDSLGPELREQVKTRLACSSPIDEAGAIRAVLYQHAHLQNVLSGAGEGATPFQREEMSIAREVYEAETELNSIEMEFLRAVGWENDVDESTGTSTPREIDKMSPERRRQLSFRRDELRHRVELLDGFEGKRRRDKAMRETLDAEARREREARVEQAAEARAEEIVFAEEVEERAKARAAFRRTER